jgi:hypothetical protein
MAGDANNDDSSPFMTRKERKRARREKKKAEQAMPYNTAESRREAKRKAMAQAICAEAARRSTKPL